MAVNIFQINISQNAIVHQILPVIKTQLFIKTTTT